MKHRMQGLRSPYNWAAALALIFMAMVCVPIFTTFL